MKFYYSVIYFVLFFSTVKCFASKVVYSYVPEVCNNGIDDDSDGLIDCLDPDCTTSTDCELAKELPFPLANVNLFPPGTLIIPMDDHQNVGAVFNLKVYGAIIHLLHQYVPVKWIIKTGKSKVRLSATLHDVNDEIDVTASVVEVTPSPTTVPSVENFKSGLFVIEVADTSSALAVINTYNATHPGFEVKVYELTTIVNMDVRYSLSTPPVVGILNDGGNKGIHIPIFEEAGLIDGAHFYSVQDDGSDILLLSTVDETACYTMLTEPHTNQSLVSTIHLDNIKDYLNSGGNFFAQCHAVQAYETETPPIESYSGELLTTLGVEVTNTASTPFTYPNADLPFGQFTGDLAVTGGSGQDWLPSIDPGGDGIDSEFQNNAHASVLTNDDGDGLEEYRAWSGKLSANSVGSNIFYLGGHNYGTSTTDLDIINGNRLMLNAMLVPAVRPAVCNPLPEYCMAIAEDSTGVLYFWDTLGNYANIGKLGANSVEAMSFNFNGLEMIAFDDDEYGLVDTAVGAYTGCRNLGTMNGSLGGINVSEVDGLTIDQNTGYLIGTESRGGLDVMFMIDPFDCDFVKDFFDKGVTYLPITGASQDIQDIAVNPQDGLIYAISSASGTAVDTIVTIDRSTGATTFVVTTDECDIRGLTFNNKGDLFGSTGTSSCNIDNSVFKIDLSTGLTELQVTLPHNEIAALACYNFVPEICGNGRDEDADGLIDCADPDCDCEPCDDNDISGYIFHDRNVDGIYFFPDFPEQGVTVHLYWDLTKDSVINGGDLLVGATTSAADGSYLFTREYLVENIIENIVAQSADDAKDGNITENVLKLGKDKWAGIRFQDVSIPDSAILNCAYIEFSSARKKDKNVSSVRIYGHDVANSPEFVEGGNDVKDRVQTAEYLDWTFGDWAGGSHYQSEDISHIIEELIDSYGVLSNTDISFILEPTGSQEREAFTYDQGAPFGPRLVLYYTPKDGGEGFMVTVDKSTLPAQTKLSTDSVHHVFFQSGGNLDSLNNIGYYFPYEVCDSPSDDDLDGLVNCDDPDCQPTVNSAFDCTADTSINVMVSGRDMPYSFEWGDWSDYEAYWTFEDTTLDVSGNGHHENLGSRIGSPLFNDTFHVQGHTSLQLDSSTYLRYSQDFAFMETAFTDWAVSFWMKPDTLNGVQYLFEEGGNTNGIAVRLNGIQLEFAAKESGSLVNAGTLTVPSDTLWHHVAAVFTNDSITVYLDGTAGTTTSTGFPLGQISNHSENGGIGYMDGGSVFEAGSGKYYGGLLDDFKYFVDQVPDPGQIVEMARNDANRYNLPRVDQYFFLTVSTASGCTAIDTVAYNCHRTLTYNYFLPHVLQTRN